MAEIDLLDLIAHARATDLQTSHDAAKTVDVKGGQAIVLATLKTYGPCTDEYLAMAARAVAKISPSGVRTRRKELTDRGLVVAAGTGTTESGRAATVWRAA